MKNDLPYFKHYNAIHNEPRMQALLAEHGFEGYGRYWALCEIIASSPNASFNISSRVIKLTVARAMEMNAEEFDRFIGFLSAPDINLIRVENDIITADFLQEDYQRVQKKRGWDRDDYNSSTGTVSEKLIPVTENAKPVSENIQSIVDQNILDQSTEYNSKETYKNLSDYFLQIWKQNPDVFNFTAKIKSQQDWKTFWKTCTFSESDIDVRMRNYIEGVKSGDIERRFIPRSPDVFVQNGHLQTSVVSYKKNKHRIANDYVDKDDASEYFTEA
jgi:hypothetical protein